MHHYYFFGSNFILLFIGHCFINKEYNNPFPVSSRCWLLSKFSRLVCNSGMSVTGMILPHAERIEAAARGPLGASEPRLDLKPALARSKTTLQGRIKTEDLVACMQWRHVGQRKLYYTLLCHKRCYGFECCKRNPGSCFERFGESFSHGEEQQTVWWMIGKRLRRYGGRRLSLRPF
jgi:hypothetical protein